MQRDICSMFKSYDTLLCDTRGERFIYVHVSGTVYLDHAGTALYPESLMTTIHEDFMNNFYGNPHTTSSCKTADAIQQVRYK